MLQAEPLLDDAVPTLVLYGDVPLIRPSTLQRLFSTGGDVALLTVQLAQPSGYGRIVRDWRGNVLRIVEERDADDDERKLTEVNTGILMAPTAKLKRWLKALSNENAQREYYLPDVIAHAVAEHCRVVAVECADPDETRGVNSKEQLATIERIAQRRIASELMERGATLADPARIDVRGRVNIGADVSIDVGCVFEGQVDLAEGVASVPWCCVLLNGATPRYCRLHNGRRYDWGARASARTHACVRERCWRMKCTRQFRRGQASTLATVRKRTISRMSSINVGANVTRCRDYYCELRWRTQATYRHRR